MAIERKLILLVEDDDFMSSVLEKRLSERFDVAVAASTQAASEVLAARPVALILLDILMPEEDGFTWLQKIKDEKSDYRQVPVIVLSNLDQREDVERGLKLGAEDYLVKGNMLPEEVAAKVAEVLG